MRAWQRTQQCINGCLAKHNFCGYNSFEVNISDPVKFGSNENVLAVYVQADEHEGWWYEGGGIYRHVWLCKTAEVAVDLWGVYVAPKKVSDTLWNVKIETEIINDRYEDVEAEAQTVFYDKDGNAVLKSNAAINIPLREKKTAVYFADIENPNLWDTENPYLYTVETVIKGVCAHQDFGITGKAVPDNIHRYKVQLIKEMGANGYRTSHYPHPEAVMDALDELGFIVMDETRWFESTDEGKAQLEMLVKRDRNRPSVLFGSVGNEEPHHLTEEGRRICKNLISFVRKLDNTRYVMSSVSNDPDIATVYDELDVIGVNYNLGKYEYIHEKYPNKGIFASECCATGTTRGWYKADCPEKAVSERIR